MPVVVEGASILIRNATLESAYPDGVAGYERDCPNSTFCTDGQISRIGFMDPKDANAYLTRLTEQGLEPDDIAVFQQDVGFATPCSWLHVAVADLPDGNEALMAWLRGTDSHTFVAPPGWSPGTIRTLTRDELERDYELVSVKKGVETRRHRVTGELIYQGRTKAPKRWWEFWK